VFSIEFKVGQWNYLDSLANCYDVFVTLNRIWNWFYWLVESTPPAGANSSHRQQTTLCFTKDFPDKDTHRWFLCCTFKVCVTLSLGLINIMLTVTANSFSWNHGQSYGRIYKKSPNSSTLIHQFLVFKNFKRSLCAFQSTLKL